MDGIRIIKIYELEITTTYYLLVILLRCDCYNCYVSRQSNLFDCIAL